MKNESAFPMYGEYVKTEYGLTKREYFAIMCLQGILAKKFDETDENVKHTILDALEYADELIKQLKK